MPTEKQIEKVARAIFDALYGGGIISISFDEARRLSRISASERHDALMHAVSVGVAETAARVAIAAMPQPIGYAVVVDDSDGWGIGSSSTELSDVTEDAADFRQDCEHGPCGHVTVVALVPVEVPV